jgi:hypothetical protein
MLSGGLCMRDDLILPHGPISPSVVEADSALNLLPVLAAIACFVLVYVCAGVYREKKYSEVKNKAIKQLNQVFANGQTTTPSQRVYQANIILKQVAEHYYNDSVIALYGESWRCFLFNTLLPEIRKKHPRYLHDTQRLLYESHLSSELNIKPDEFYLWLEHGLPRFNWFTLSPQKTNLETA